MSDWQATGLPCDDCGSKDNRAINADGYSMCFTDGCDKRYKVNQGDTMSEVSNKAAPDKPLSSTTITLLANAGARAEGIPDRGITAATVKKYGVVVSGERHIYPYYDAEGEDVHVPLAAQKRLPGKVFPSEGPLKKCGLFGQQLFPAGGKRILVAEGATDAMAAFQMRESKWPTVAVRNAPSALADAKRNYEYLDSFEEIYICMDADKAGDKAAKQLGELFGAKAKLMKIKGGYSDPVDCNMGSDAGHKAFMDAYWNAESYTPDGILAGSEMWDMVNTPLEKAACQYPYEGLNAITYGIRMAELVTVCAGSGLGKSQFLREIIWHLIQNTDDNIGCMFLEENARKTGLSLMSLACDQPLHLPTTEASETTRRAAFDATLGTGKLFFFDHFGSTSVDNIVARARYYVKALDCKYLMLDHVSIIVSAQESGDERKTLDEIMTKLRTMVQELNISLFLVSHLRRPDGKGHEEGSATSLSQLRGSASIAQLSDIVLGLERNGQADDPDERNTTRVRVLKNRFSGETGMAAALRFDKGTGRMNEVDEIDEMDSLENAL